MESDEEVVFTNDMAADCLHTALMLVKAVAPANQSVKVPREVTAEACRRVDAIMDRLVMKHDISGAVTVISAFLAQMCYLGSMDGIAGGPALEAANLQIEKMVAKTDDTNAALMGRIMLANQRWSVDDGVAVVMSKINAVGPILDEKLREVATGAAMRHEIMSMIFMFASMAATSLIGSVGPMALMNVLAGYLADVRHIRHSGIPG